MRYVSDAVHDLLRWVPFRRTWLLLPIDIIAICFATFLSFELRFNGSIPTNFFTSYYAFSIVRPILYVCIFLVFHMYTRFWRYAGVNDVRAIIEAVTVASVLTKAIDIVIPNIILPNSVWVSTYLLTLVMVGGARLSLKVYGARNRKVIQDPNGPLPSRVLILGAGAAGSLVVREAERDLRHGWDIVGFIDDDKQKQGLMLDGKPVLGTRNDISQVVQDQNIDTILIAIPSMERSTLRELVDGLNTLHIPVLIIPPFTRWAVKNLFAQIRPVEVEDLLGRDPLPVDVSKVGDYLKDATVLVTGAGGSIGSEICRQVAMLSPKCLVVLGRGENSIFEIHRELLQQFPELKVEFVIGDIRDLRKMSTVFSKYQPDVVFHAAAHKHVPLMEEHPDEAFQNNVLGTRNLADLSISHGVKRFILVSSDKAVRPTNVMGASKRVAEMVVQDAALDTSYTNFVGVRFGNVLGSRGSVVRVFREQISKGGPITVTDPRMQRYFMTIPEAVRLVIEAGAVGQNGNIYLLDMGEPVRILHLAERMIKLSGFTPGVDIPIQVTGIRPGEKLFEELSREGDSVSIDPDERIWSVSCPTMSRNNFQKKLEYLADLYSQNAIPQLAQAIKDLAWWEPEPEQVGQAETAAGTADASLLGL